jgi:hypothetical protein
MAYKMIYQMANSNKVMNDKWNKDNVKCRYQTRIFKLRDLRADEEEGRGVRRKIGAVA